MGFWGFRWMCISVDGSYLARQQFYGNGTLPPTITEIKKWVLARWGSFQFFFAQATFPLLSWCWVNYSDLSRRGNSPKPVVKSKGIPPKWPQFRSRNLPVICPEWWKKGRVFLELVYRVPIHPRWLEGDFFHQYAISGLVSLRSNILWAAQHVECEQKDGAGGWKADAYRAQYHLHRHNMIVKLWNKKWIKKRWTIKFACLFLKKIEQVQVYTSFFFVGQVFDVNRETKIPNLPRKQREVARVKAELEGVPGLRGKRNESWGFFSSHWKRIWCVYQGEDTVIV